MSLSLPLPIIAEKPIGEATVQTVRGRDVHAFLGVAKDYSNWMRAQVERARLVEGRDFVVETGGEVSAQKGENPRVENSTVAEQGVSRGGRPRTEHHLTLDAAKHVGMMSGTERGFDLREYFLECERRAKAPVPAIVVHAIPQTYAEALQAAADLARENDRQRLRLEAAEPKAAALDAIGDAAGSCSVTDAAKSLKMPPSELWAYLYRAQWVYRREHNGDPVAYQAKILAGFLTHRAIPVDTGSARKWIKSQVRVTAKGIAALALRIPLDTPPMLDKPRPGDLFGSSTAPARA